MKISAHHPFRSAKAKAEYLALNDNIAKDWPVALECSMIDTSYGQTFVRISGPVDAPPLVLLPGGNLCSLMWIPNIESLSQCYRVYAVDTLIFTGTIGRSMYTRTIKSSDGAVKWLDELFNALDIGDSINLVGMSYGGWLTGQYALHSPDRLNRVVLLAPAATVAPLRLEFILWGILLYLVPARYLYKRFFYWLLDDLAQDDRQMMEVFVNLMVTARLCFKSAKYAMPTVLRDDELQSIKVPILFLVGENDLSCYAQKAVQRLSKVAPQIQAEVISDVGHSLTFVQVEKVNQKILEFLAQS